MNEKRYIYKVDATVYYPTSEDPFSCSGNYNNLVVLTKERDVLEAVKKITDELLTYNQTCKSGEIIKPERVVVHTVFFHSTIDCIL